MPCAERGYRGQDTGSAGVVGRSRVGFRTFRGPSPGRRRVGRHVRSSPELAAQHRPAGGGLAVVQATFAFYEADTPSCS